MGIGDIYEPRPRSVPVHEHVQHLLRLAWVWNAHSDRFVWAVVNHVLLQEAAGKSIVVHRNMMRRLGGRIREQAALTKAQLRRILADEDTARAMIGSLQRQGRTVRSTPMQWSWEGKKFDATLKHFAWRPPWVLPSGPEVADEFSGYLPEEHRVEDAVGLDRLPSAWWTLNTKYNAVYDVHRLNVRDPSAREAVEAYQDTWGRCASTSCAGRRTWSPLPWPCARSSSCGSSCP